VRFGRASLQRDSDFMSDFTSKGYEVSQGNFNVPLVNALRDFSTLKLTWL